MEDASTKRPSAAWFVFGRGSPHLGRQPLAEQARHQPANPIQRCSSAPLDSCERRLLPCTLYITRGAGCLKQSALQRGLADAWHLGSQTGRSNRPCLALLQADKLGYIDKIRSIRASASTKPSLALQEDPAAARPRQKPSSQVVLLPGR